LLQKEGAKVSYNDPFFEYVGRGRKYNLEMKTRRWKIWANTIAYSS